MKKHLSASSTPYKSAIIKVTDKAELSIEGNLPSVNLGILRGGSNDFSTYSFLTPLINMSTSPYKSCFTKI